MTRLGLVEMDLLATHAGASIPYPLRVPSFGRIPAERDELFAIAGETLEARGLATAAGPAGPAADLVSALGNRRGTVDIVVRGPDDTRGAVAIIYGQHAVVCGQVFTTDVTDSLVDVRRIPLSAVGGALTALVPEVPGATTMPIQLPSAAAYAAHDLIEAGGDIGYRLHQLIEDHGGDADEFDSLNALLTTISGGGQLGATSTGRNGKDSRTGPELSWLDTPSGRVRVSVPPPDTDGWISVNPLRPDALRAAVEDMVDALR